VERLQVKGALLDTSILIAFVSPDEATPDLSEFVSVQVSSLSWHELTLGLHLARDIAEYRRRTQALSGLRSVFGAGLPYDDQCVAAGDDILARAVERGATARAHVFDRMIAATALANDLVLVTRNAADLRGLDGLLEVTER
jgi:predicted nucleic acid-binding protein